MEPTSLNIKKNVNVKSNDTLPGALNISSNTLQIKNIVKNEVPSALNISKTENSKDPTHLNINKTKKILIEEEKNFSFSFEYLKNKLPNINNFIYQNISEVLEKVQRNNNKIADNDLLYLGKKLQEDIGTITTKFVSFEGVDIIKEITDSHKKIVDDLMLNKKENNKIMSSIKNIMSGEKISSIKNIILGEKNEPLKNEQVIEKLTNSISENKNIFKPKISKSLINFPKMENKLDSLKDEINIYVDFCKILKEEFLIEGFECNNDLLNRRIESLINSSVLLSTTKTIVESYKKKLLNLEDNIDNVINILIPLYISKLKLSQIDDKELNKLSELIVNKLIKEN